MRFSRFYGSVAICALAAFPAGVAWAQSAPANSTPAGKDVGLSEIVVTAQKRVENVQSVPISVTLVSAAQLERRGVQSLQDLSQASASLEFTAPGAAPGGGGFVRGIGTNGIGTTTGQSSVSVVLDGVVLGNINVTDIFDTERVEVLKGPQGTLFGSSVSAGVLNMTTKAPKLGETSGYVSGEIAGGAFGSKLDRKMLRAAVNLPVSDTSALRIAAQAKLADGLTHDTVTGADESFSSYSIRARYLAELGDRVTLNLIGDYNRTVDTNGTNLIYRSVTAGSPLANALTACGVKVSASNTDNCDGTSRFSRNQIGGASAQLDVKLGGGSTLTSITSWRGSAQTYVGDVFGIDPTIMRTYMPSCLAVGGCLPVVYLTTGTGTNPAKTKQSLFTQEVRVASDANRHLEWVAGLYFQRATYHNNQPGSLAINFGAPSDLVLFNAASDVSARMSDYAAFGNATYYLNPETRIIAGLRFTHSNVWETKSDAPSIGVSTYYTGSTKADALTWRAGLQHDFGRDSMAYLTVSTGYKAPMLSDNLSNSTVLSGVKPEKPISFEVGFKHSMFGRRLFVNADVFYTRVNDLQGQSCVTGNSGLACTNINVPKVISKGLEWDIFGKPWAGASVNVSGILSDAKYPTGFTGADGSALAGYQLNYAPRFKMTVSLEQEFPINDKYSLTVGGDAAIRSSVSMYLASGPQYTVGAQTLLNARISLKSQANWSVSFFGRNLGDKIYPTQLYPTTAFASGGLWQVLDANSRRTAGLQFEAKF